MTNYFHKLLITGGKGQLALALAAHPLAKRYQIATYTREELDINNPDAILKTIEAIKPDIIINTAAYTAVDRAEIEQEKAYAVNVDGAKNIAIAASTNKIPLIHLSTDYVFDGKKTIPYDEEETPHPINYYGETKYLGEQAILNHSTSPLILRVSGLFSPYQHNFVKTIYRLAQQKETLQVIDDQITCPTAASDLAETLFQCAQKIVNHHSYIQWGIYHYCSEEAISWHGFAEAIMMEMQQQHFPITLKNISKIAAKDYQTAAKRPAYSVLNCEKLKTHFGILQPNWQKSLRETLCQLKIL